MTVICSCLSEFTGENRISEAFFQVWQLRHNLSNLQRKHVFFLTWEHRDLSFPFNSSAAAISPGARHHTVVPSLVLTNYLGEFVRETLISTVNS